METTTQALRRGHDAPLRRALYQTATRRPPPHLRRAEAGRVVERITHLGGVSLTTDRLHRHPPHVVPQRHPHGEGDENANEGGSTSFVAINGNCVLWARARYRNAEGVRARKWRAAHTTIPLGGIVLGQNSPALRTTSSSSYSTRNSHARRRSNAGNADQQGRANS